ncbi:hypothetical protein [Hyalangium gracile]|uniref:hypothetical protein n=1 Tax=Hyalangium gracile TaxID=394092 RepID=UPI001CCDB97C|nr:hypothetical protein [Hyalangium gracile]
MEPSLVAQTLLPDLPDEEPWYELKFQFQELHEDCSRLLRKLLPLAPQLTINARSRHIYDELFDIHGVVHHDAKDHARRAMELAGYLLTRSPGSIPEWNPGEDGTADFSIPLEVSACTSLDTARARLTFHVEGLRSAIDKALQAVLRAASLRGARHQVLEAVQAEATGIYETLHNVALPHAQAAYCWSEQHWRLADPEGAAAHDQRSAEIDAELASLEEE